MDHDIAPLKQAYALLQSREIVYEYGPLRAYRDYDAAQRLWRETIDPAVLIVQKSQHSIADGKYVARNLSQPSGNTAPFTSRTASAAGRLRSDGAPGNNPL